MGFTTEEVAVFIAVVGVLSVIAQVSGYSDMHVVIQMAFLPVKWEIVHCLKYKKEFVSTLSE
jgi:uncharacterized membrane protein